MLINDGGGGGGDGVVGRDGVCDPEFYPHADVGGTLQQVEDNDNEHEQRTENGE